MLSHKNPDKSGGRARACPVSDLTGMACGGRRSPGRRGVRARMDRFVSNTVLRLDAKGRVSIPASFRSVLARDGFVGLFGYPALDQPAVDAGGHALLAEIEGLVNRFRPIRRSGRSFRVALYGRSETVNARRRGPRGAVGGVEVACRDRRRGRVRRARPPVPDLGAAAFPRPPREGHRDGAHVDAANSALSVPASDDGARE